jgi:predicted MFS family arabinose efflux permease
MAALAAGLVAPACYALASTLGGSDNRGKMLAIVGAGFTSALVLGVPLGVIISKYTGWRGALIFVAILGAIAALGMLGAGVPEPDSTKSAPSLSEQMRILGRPETLSVLTPFLIWSIANFGLYTFIAAILGRLGSATAVPYLLLLFGLGCMAGNFIGGSLSDRYGPQRPTIFCLGMLICRRHSASQFIDSCGGGHHDRLGRLHGGALHASAAAGHCRKSRAVEFDTRPE